MSFADSADMEVMRAPEPALGLFVMLQRRPQPGVEVAVNVGVMLAVGVLLRVGVAVTVKVGVKVGGVPVAVAVGVDVKGTHSSYRSASVWYGSAEELCK